MAQTLDTCKDHQELENKRCVSIVGSGGNDPRRVWAASPLYQAKRGSCKVKQSAAAGASKARQPGQAERGSCMGKQSAAAVWASKARQL